MNNFKTKNNLDFLIPKRAPPAKKKSQWKKTKTLNKQYNLHTQKIKLKMLLGLDLFSPLVI